jgi:hypothetical protein
MLDVSVLRFSAARDVFEAFPTAYEDIATKPHDQLPLAFLRELVKGPTPDDAIPFCAYLLPRREAVRWASQSVRALVDKPTKYDEVALIAAEDWVRAPEDKNRRRALQIGTMANQRAASTWVALAAAWSGGPMIVSEYGGGPPAPPQLTARAAFTAIRIALGGKPDRVGCISQCVERGVRIAER